MRRSIAGGVIALMLGIAGHAAAQTADIDAAKALYAAASYEEALKALDGTADASTVDLVDQYRALCHLALNRQRDAEAAIERIVNRSPEFRIDAATASPKLVELLGQVRVRLLPVMARRVYAEAKGQYDLSQYTQARDAFMRLEVVLKEAETAGVAGGLSDLLQLGQGFLELTNRQLARTVATMEAALPPPDLPTASASAGAPVPSAAAPATASAAPPAPAPVATPAPAPVAPSPAVNNAPVMNTVLMYNAGDAGVAPPVALSREFPAWTPPAGATTVRGALEVVVNEQGLVESAVIRAPTTPAYDRALLTAAREWRFRPATREGRPVKYRLLLSVVLNGRR